MSTKPTASFSTPKKAAHPEQFASGLCTSFLSSGLRLTVRPFCVATDIPIVFKWMGQEFAGPLLARSQPPHELEEFYTSVIESDFAQPFMGLINDTPVCQLDIYKTQLDIISLSYPARPGDYGLQLTLAPLIAEDNMALLLRTCLEYFFSFPEVGRIIVNIEAENEHLRQLFKKLRFRILSDAHNGDRSSSLYACTAGHFRRAHTAVR
jgi:hypothetical protein